MAKFEWNKPVLCIFRERSPDYEPDPFVVVKARRLEISKSDEGKINGKIQDFFTLMGDADYLSSSEGKSDHYVLCWFDDQEPDMTKDLRRLLGVTFLPEVTYKVGAAHKRTYQATFEAEYGKLK